MSHTTTMSIRELTRSGKKLKEYDYIDIEDRKSHDYKGVFVSEKYADEVKEFLEKRLEEEQKKQLEDIMRFAGKVRIEERFQNKSAREIREIIAKEKYGE